MKSLIRFLAVALCVVFLAQAAPAAAAPVEARLPDFPIQINDTTIDNSHRTYPFLWYKGVTYLPLTYFDCQALGTRTEYDDTNGLRVNPADTACAVPNDTQAAANPTKVKASTVDFPVVINGTPYQNDRWPLLHYRYITYLPLTWEVAHNVLGWNYFYDEGSRTLAISGMSPMVNRLSVPDSATIAAADEHNTYYVTSEGDRDDTAGTTLTVWRQKDGATALKLGRTNGYNEKLHLLTEPYFSAYFGGPTMGSDNLYRLNDNDMTELRSPAKFVNFFDTPYGKINASYDMMGTLKIEDKKAESGWQGLAPNLAVGAESKAGGYRGANMMGLGLDGDWFSFYAAPGDSFSRPYRINLANRQIEAIGDRFISSKYRIYDGALYYEENSSLYRAALSDVKNGVRQLADAEKILDNVKHWNIDDCGAILYNTTNPADGWHLRNANGDDEKIAKGENTNDKAIYAQNGVLCAQTDDGLLIVQHGKKLCDTDCLVTANARPVISTDGFLVYNDGRGYWHKICVR